jgi:hypothetical protein
MSTPELRHVDWATAQIEDGTLTVELTGRGTRAWKARFENVLALLDTPHSKWGEVRLKKNAVKVDGPQQGSEAELRHLLESSVLQANSDTQPEPPEEDAETDDAGGVSDADRQMTATFRSFAQRQEDDR